MERPRRDPAVSKDGPDIWTAARCPTMGDSAASEGAVCGALGDRHPLRHIKLLTVLGLPSSKDHGKFSFLHAFTTGFAAMSGLSLPTESAWETVPPSALWPLPAGDPPSTEQHGAWGTWPLHQGVGKWYPAHAPGFLSAKSSARRQDSVGWESATVAFLLISFTVSNVYLVLTLWQRLL